jgi:hypothetical protein
MLSELGRLTAQMRAASGARATRQPADGRALEAHQRHVKEEKVMSQTGDFHWLINNLLWQLIYRASGFGFLPKQLFTAAFIKRPARTCPVLRYAICGLVRSTRDRPAGIVRAAIYVYLGCSGVVTRPRLPTHPRGN